MSTPLVKKINRYLRKQGSPLAGKGQVFVQAGRRHKVNPLLLLGIGNAETSLGKAGRGPAVHNYFGLGPGMEFGSDRESINYLAKLLKKDYLGAGLNTVSEISGRYVTGNVNDPQAGWTANVQATMQALGGGGPLGKAPPGGGQISSKKTASKGTTKKRTLTNLPEIQAQRDLTQQQFALDMIEASQARARGERSNMSPVLNSLALVKEAEQRKPTELTIDSGSKPARAGSQADGKKTRKFAPNGVGVIRGSTPGGGPEAHGSRPLGNWQSDHAWDLMAPAGTPVFAPVDGVVDPNAGFGFRSNGSTVWGRRLTIRGGGNAFFMTHLGKYAKGVKPGRRVKKGQLIGWLGNPPGFAPHLHIGLLKGDLSDYM